MQIKFVRAAILCLLSLASITIAEFVVTTADGNGADGGVSNDGNQNYDWSGGVSATVAIRNYADTRAKAAIVRFDLGSGIGGDNAGAVLSITETSGNRGRTVNVYGLVDGAEGEDWTEETISYENAPGLLNPDNSGNITIDDTVWALVGTMSFVDNRGDGNPVEITLASEDLDNFIAADTDGLVSFFFYTADSDSSHSYYVAMKENGSGIPSLTFPNARFATDPAPEKGETVLTSHTTLSWINTAPEAAGVISCDVFIGQNEPNVLAPENDYDLTKIETGTTDTTITIPFSLNPGTYYWIVDSYEDDTHLGTGTIWNFDVTAAPQIISDPEAQLLMAGETADFSVAVESLSDVTYTWYKSIDNANDTSADDTVVGGDSEMLSIANVGTANEGYYYCKAVNNAGESMAAYSGTAGLGVKRKVAHWTMDTLVTGQYEDISGEGHPADPNSTDVTFVDGVEVAVTAQAAVFDDTLKAYANSGTWGPTYASGQFTLAFWMNWDGTGSGFKGLLAKHNGWASATTLWQFGLSSGNDLALVRAGGTSVYGQDVPANQWLYVAVTFDGSTATIYSYEPGSGAISFATSSGAYSLGGMVDADFNIGCSFTDANGAAEAFSGIMDDIQVYNYAKSATEIADLYNLVIAQDFCILEYGDADTDLDLDNDCRIDLFDFAALASGWLDCGLYPNCQ